MGIGSIPHRDNPYNFEPFYVQSKSLGTLSSKENLVSDHPSKSEALNGNLHEADTSNRSTSSETSNDQVVPKRRQKKRSRDETTGVDALPCRRMPRRAAACLDFKEKAVCMPDEDDSVVNVKREPVVDEEIAAINLTVCQDMSHPERNASTRHLSNFTFHDVGGKLQSVDMLQVTDLFITGVIHPSKPNADKRKENGVRCRCFGRIESWRISGFEDGLPVIWVSTQIADYECIKPATSYRKIFGHFFEKVHACVQVYRTLSKYSGGNVDIGLHELLAAVVRSMKGSKNFSTGVSIKEFLISQGDFIYNQLIGLDTMSKDSDQKFSGLPVLIALQEECKKNTSCLPENRALSIKIGDAGQADSSNLLKVVPEEDEDAKLARFLQDEEDWRSMNQRKGRRERSSSKYYIMMNEDEIAADYPLPAYYKPTSDETDEYTIFDDMCMYDADQLPINMLHNWSLYNSDSRLVSLELLPMKPCGEIDFAIFGSGIMTEDIGSGFCYEDDSIQSSTSTELENVDGIPVYLSEIKEWMIEFGASMVFISIRTDLAWYRLGKPSKQYAPWYEMVLRTARLSISIITLLKEQSRVARFSVKEMIKRLSEFEKCHPAFISSNPVAVERYVVVHGQIILQQFAEYPDNNIRRCPFVSELQTKMEERHHTKCLVKKKAVTKKGINLNPRAAMVPIKKKQLLPATTTRLINRIWGEFYSNYSPEDSKNTVVSESKEEPLEEQDEDAEEDLEEQDDDIPVLETVKSHQNVRTVKLQCSVQDIKWVDESTQNMSANEALYEKADVLGDFVVVGG
uniref:RFTS domain-containing protein n=1 Tax=Chenopodium quinoa TaxID=63459 RepID=A0A803MEX4_CHEQI